MNRPLAETLIHFLPLKAYFVRNRWPLLVGLLSLLAVDFLQLVIPLIIKRAIDQLTAQTATSHALFHYGMVILALALVIALLRYVWRHLILGHSRVVEEGLRNRLYDHLQRLSPSFYRRTKTGDLMARSINDINAVRMASGMGLVALTDGLVLGTAAIGFMMSINLKLTLISMIPAPAVVLVTRILTRRMSTGFETAQETFSHLTERVRESISGIRVIKAYNRENWAHDRIRQSGEQYIAVNMSLAKTFALFFPLMAVLTNTGLAIVVWLGGRLTILGDITPGDFVAFTSYLNLMTWPIMAMGWVTNLIQRGAASMRRINRILEETPEIRDPAGPGQRPREWGRISIRGLNFRYPGQQKNALNDIQLDVEAGQTLAVVGRVGSGKSTLLHALPRLLQVHPETILIDGKDVLDIPLKTLRTHIGFVTQEAFVFSDTIRNNVRFGRRDVSEEDLEAALRTAFLWEDIQTLDAGLDTLLGERGLTLSGGQRQRLTIARAILSHPPLLILDDALSMVDTLTEKRILDQILESRQSLTNVIVSNRVATIRRAHRIAVLDQGTLVEQGTHDHLLKQGKVYNRIYERQLLTQELETGSG
jgi:ATP-binding cassette subfamily B protein